MVELLRLERADTYRTSGTSTPIDQVEAESSRRTVWSLLIADDSLAVACGSNPPNKLDVTIHTPCDEDDWDFGSIPSIITPETASRSMMGNTVSLSNSGSEQKISAMSLWSRAARWASAVERGDSLRIPWDPHSEFTEIDRQCREFIDRLSPRLRYSSTILAAHRTRKMDMVRNSGVKLSKGSCSSPSCSPRHSYASQAHAHASHVGISRQRTRGNIQRPWLLLEAVRRSSLPQCERSNRYLLGIYGRMGYYDATGLHAIDGTAIGARLTSSALWSSSPGP